MQLEGSTTHSRPCDSHLVINVGLVGAPRAAAPLPKHHPRPRRLQQRRLRLLRSTRRRLGGWMEVSSMRRAYSAGRPQGTEEQQRPFNASAALRRAQGAEEQPLMPMHLPPHVTQPFHAGHPLLLPSPCRALATARRRRTGCLSGAAPPPQTSRVRPPGWQHRRPPQSSPPALRCTCAGWVQGAAQVCTACCHQG